MTPRFRSLPRALVHAALVLALSSAAAHAKPFLLLLDPGHMPEAPGATSARGAIERTFNQNIAKLLMEKLAGIDGLRVMSTNGPADSVGLPERPKMSNELHADIFLSLHHDSVQDVDLKPWTFNGAPEKYCDDAQGYSIFVAANKPLYKQSFAFAKTVATKLEQNGLSPNLYHARRIHGESRILIDSALGIYDRSDLAVLRLNDRPAILVECGVIVNRQEEERLLDPAYQALIVNALYDAVLEYKASVDGFRTSLADDAP